MEEKIISAIQNLTNLKVNINSSIEELGIDSLDLVQLVVDAENEFNIQIDDEEIAGIKYVKDFINLAKSKLSN
ncbi:phosphopantetheine-binding protein [Mycoplasma elephantis]|uniref:phosphopantetheine-binding protein n=1 Tax=Mycoplasma elephantis TaxID=114882 RepID=UPI000489ABF7|nr:phosphopantetheine-binding protein [Mycoplasma elephantis]